MKVWAFVPSYDPCTKANASIANQLPRFKFRKNLVQGDDATREEFMRIVSDGGAIFAMSHGDTHSVSSQHDREPAVHSSDVAVNLNRILECNIFAWACKTSGAIGREFRRSGAKGSQGIWWGYSVSVSAPDRHVHADYIKLFSFITENFPLVSNEKQALKFKESLILLSNPVYQRIVADVARSKKYRGLHESAVLFQEVHNYLDISFANGLHIPGASRPMDALGF